MRFVATRQGLFVLGLLFALGLECPPPPHETDCLNFTDDDQDFLVDCNDPDCANDPACKPTPEICDDGQDNDGDGKVDGDDRDCEPDPSPVIEAACTSQDTTAQAGSAVDTTDEPTGCATPTAANSGQGDTATLSFEVLGSVVKVTANFSADDPAALPNVTTDFTVEVPYERGGSHVWLSVLGGAQGNVVWQMTGTCDGAEGYEIPALLPGFEVPTDIDGGTIACDFHLDAELVDVGTGELVVYAGASVARNTDGDATSDRNDLCNGCGQEGHFGPANAYRFACANPPADPCAISPDATPDYCENCWMAIGNAVANAPADGSLLYSSTSDELSITNGSLFRSYDGTYNVPDEWRIRGTSVRYQPENDRVQCSGDDCIYEMRGAAPIDCPNGCQSIASLDALENGGPQVARIYVASGDPSVDGEFTLRVSVDGGPFEDLTIPTNGGVGIDEFVLVFDESAIAEALPATGFAPATDDCPGPDLVATFELSASCTFTYAPLDQGDVFETGVVNGESFSELPLGFGVGPSVGELFAINGQNGIEVRRESNRSVVPELTELNFLFANVLDSLFLKPPPGAAGAFDTVFFWKLVTGAQFTVFEDDGWGISQLDFGSYRSGNHRDGDPERPEAFVVSSGGGIVRLSYVDVGGGQFFLNDAPYVNASALPTGFTAWAAFGTSDSTELLIAAQSTTAGAEGKLFRASPTTGAGAAIEVGPVDPGVRLGDCAQAVAPAWVCVFTSFGGDATSVIWVPGVSAQIAQEIETGLNGLDVLVAADGTNVDFAITNYGDDSLTIGTADGTTGHLISSESRPLPEGFVQPSSLHLTEDKTLLVLGRDAAHNEKTLALSLTGLF